MRRITLFALSLILVLATFVAAGDPPSPSDTEIEVVVALAKAKRKFCLTDDCRQAEAKVEEAVAVAKAKSAPLPKAPESFIDSTGRRWYRHPDGSNRSSPPAASRLPDCPTGNCPLIR